MIVRISVHKVHKNCKLFLCNFTYFFVALCAVNECIKATTLILYYTSIFLYIQTKPERQGRSDVNDGILFYTPFTHEKNACISTSSSMIYHLFICCTVSEQNPHVITAGIENTVNINFASVSTVEANVIVPYIKR